MMNETGNRADTKVSPFNWDLFCPSRKYPKSGNAIQPSI